jgi:ribosome-binding protein aMBF1 (putative translation factor)
LPVIRRPTTFQLKEAEQTSGVYERLSKMAGLDAGDHFKKFHREELRRQGGISRKGEVSLKELVDKNYPKHVQTAVALRASKEDMIDNFHWIIMRARRMKKWTQDKLAKEIFESKAAIEMAERGVLPEDGYRLVAKLESVLGIRIMKNKRPSDFASMNKSQEKKELRFDGESPKKLTISDIKEMQAKYNTDVMSEEIEEDIKINQEGAEKFKEEGKKKGFFSRVFGDED